jgi:hypothetical protein
MITEDECKRFGALLALPDCSLSMESQSERKRGGENERNSNEGPAQPSPQPVRFPRRRLRHVLGDGHARLGAKLHDSAVHALRECRVLRNYNLVLP